MFPNSCLVTSEKLVFVTSPPLLILSGLLVADASYLRSFVIIFNIEVSFKILFSSF